MVGRGPRGPSKSNSAAPNLLLTEKSHNWPLSVISAPEEGKIC